jgi:hypothetical protein
MWNLKKCGRNYQYEFMLKILGPHFRHWDNRLGLMDVPEILISLELLQFGFEEMVLVRDDRQLLEFVSPRIGRYLMGFVFITRPTGHTMAVADWNGDTVRLMDAGLPNAGFQRKPWADLMRENDPSFLFLFQ